MATETEVPESFAAGTTVKFTITDPDHPADDGWGMNFVLAGAGVLSSTGQATAKSHAFTLAATATAELPAGSYRWALTATKGEEVEEVDDGRLTVKPNLAAAGAGDLQSSNEKLLAAIDAMIAKRMGTGTGSLPQDIEAYSIDGVTVTKVPLEQLQKSRVVYAYAVNRERGGGIGRQHRIAFTRGDS